MTAACDKRHYAHKVFRVGRGLIQRHVGGFPRLVDHYVALSNRSAEILAPYLPTTAHLHYLENAIDWKKPPRVDAAGNSTVLYIGRLDQEKGVLLLADAVESLGMAATFVGEGPLRPELENRKGIHLTGWVDRDEVRRHLATARCAVFPSLWYETYGLVVAEAAAHGIPVIVSDITAAAERVEDGVTGWLFRSGDRGDLMRCLEATRNNDDVARMGAAAYEQFWSQATTSADHAADLLKVYRAILTPRPSTA
jgi:glycosyltransferase involved in cell wall biosynthesis